MNGALEALPCNASRIYGKHKFAKLMGNIQNVCCIYTHTHFFWAISVFLMAYMLFLCKYIVHLHDDWEKSPSLLLLIILVYPAGTWKLHASLLGQLGRCVYTTQSVWVSLLLYERHNVVKAVCSGRMTPCTQLYGAGGYTALFVCSVCAVLLSQSEWTTQWDRARRSHQS